MNGTKFGLLDLSSDVLPSERDLVAKNSTNFGLLDLH